MAVTRCANRPLASMFAVVDLFIERQLIQSKPAFRQKRQFCGPRRCHVVNDATEPTRRLRMPLALALPQLPRISPWPSSQINYRTHEERRDGACDRQHNEEHRATYAGSTKLASPFNTKYGPLISIPKRDIHLNK